VQANSLFSVTYWGLKLKSVFRAFRPKQPDQNLMALLFFPFNYLNFVVNFFLINQNLNLLKDL